MYYLNYQSQQQYHHDRGWRSDTYRGCTNNHKYKTKNQILFELIVNILDVLFVDLPCTELNSDMPLNWLVSCVLCHIKPCRLFNAKSCLQIVTSNRPPLQLGLGSRLPVSSVNFSWPFDLGHFEYYIAWLIDCCSLSPLFGLVVWVETTTILVRWRLSLAVLLELDFSRDKGNIPVTFLLAVFSFLFRLLLCLFSLARLWIIFWLLIQNTFHIYSVCFYFHPLFAIVCFCPYYIPCKQI